MENIFDLGKKSYVAASLPPKRSISEHISIGLEILFDFFTVLILAIIYSFETLYHVFVPKLKKNVAGQVALITGGGNGIGKQIALRLAHEGCKIAIVDIERMAAIQTAEEILQINGQAKGYHFDISDASAVEKLRLEVQNDFGPVDILVNNAAVLPMGSFMSGSYEHIKRVIDVNINAVMLMTHVFLEIMMRRRKGHIVNMISLTSYHPIPGGTVYSSTKSALRGFTEALAQELRIDGYDKCIHLTGVHPYFVATRKDLMDAVKELRLPALTPVNVANAAVDGMLRNESVVSVPPILLKLTIFSSMLPIKIQNAIRDHILKERDFKEHWQK